MTIASDYLPILFMIILGSFLAATFSFIGYFLGPRLRGEAKSAPFESGFLKEGTQGQRYDVKFYMTALVFLIFDGYVCCSYSCYHMTIPPSLPVSVFLEIVGSTAVRLLC